MSENVNATALTEMIHVEFTGLTNGETYYVRVYPVNPGGLKQSEVGTQVGVATPKA